MCLLLFLANYREALAGAWTAHLALIGCLLLMWIAVWDAVVLANARKREAGRDASEKGSVRNGA